MTYHSILLVNIYNLQRIFLFFKEKEKYQVKYLDGTFFFRFTMKGAM